MNANTQTIGVAGLGLLGRGIAACCLAHGFRVIAFTQSEKTLRSARDYISQAIEDLIQRAGFSSELKAEWPTRWIAVHSLERFAECDFVIETVIEDTEAKKKVFDQIEAVVGPRVPIASNSSSITITQIQSDRKNPQRFVGMHWAEPAHVTRFLELIRGEQSSEAALQSAAELGKRFGKDPCFVQKDVPAFIVNRIGYAMYREATHLLDIGVADVETIDRSCRNAFGLWAAMCGPLRWIDITGGPAAYARAVERVMPSLNSNTKELPKSFDKLRQEDAQGVANGRGFYQYQEGEKEEWEKRFREHAWRVKEWMDEHYPLKEDRI